MEKKEFIGLLEADLKAALNDGTSVQQQEIQKMNRSYTALTVTPSNSNVGVSLNVDMLYEHIQQGGTYENILSYAVNQANLSDAPQFNVDSLKDYSQTKGKLFVEIVGADRNEDILSGVPHVRIEDMAIIYRIQIEYAKGSASCLITNQLMEHFGVTEEQLHRDAIANAAIIHPAKVQKLSEVIAELGGMPLEEMAESSAPPLLVVTNEDNNMGASALFYPGMMESLAEQVEGNYFVLPSSIHEVLIMPDGYMSAEELKAMVANINGDVVDPSEVLTDQVYHYDAANKVFELGKSFEARKTLSMHHQ